MAFFGKNILENPEITIMINQFSMLMPKDSTILSSQLGYISENFVISEFNQTFEVHAKIVI